MHHTDHDRTAETGPGRRTVLAAGALGVLGVAALAGCGGDASEAVSSATDAATDAVKDVISKATIPVGGGTVITAQKVVVTQPTAGDFKAFSAVCPHQGCIVSQVANGTITCGSPCGHGSQFDAATGALKGGPATKGLTPKKVTVSGDGLTIT